MIRQGLPPIIKDVGFLNSEFLNCKTKPYSIYLGHSVTPMEHGGENESYKQIHATCHAGIAFFASDLGVSCLLPAFMKLWWARLAC